MWKSTDTCSVTDKDKMPFVSGYTHSFYARSVPLPAWVPDSSTEGLEFWIDASDTSSYSQAWFSGSHYGLNSITDKAGGNTITINNSGNTNDVPPQVTENASGIADLPVFEFGAESLTTGQFTQVDSNGNHFSIGLVRAGDGFTGNPFGAGFSTFWGTESNATLGRRDYGLELGNASYFYGQLSLDSLATPNRINNDDVVQYGGVYNPPGPNTDQNLLRFDGFGNNSNFRGNAVWFIMAIVFNKTGNQILVRVDGENAFTPVDYDSTLNTDLAMRIAVNRTHDNDDTNLHCQIGELMTFAAPPGTGGTDMSDVEKMEGYLAHKWGVENLLPNAHPYKYQYPIADSYSGGGGSTSTDTFMGVEFDNYSGAFGDMYGTYIYGTNAGTSQGTGFPSQSFYTTQNALGEKGTCGSGASSDFPRITAAGQPVGITWHAFHFKGANNGQYATAYPSPNRLICTFAEASNGQSLASAGYIGDEWTIEMWFYPDSSPAYTQEANKHQVLFDGRSNASGGADNPVILLRADGTIRMGSGNQGASIIHTTYPLESSTGAVSFDSWHHLAVTKTAGTGANNISIFVDGTEVGGGIANTTVNPGFYDPSFSTFYLGDDYYGENGNGRRGFSGGIHNVRVSKGNRYTSNFTPPTTPLT